MIVSKIKKRAKEEKNIYLVCLRFLSFFMTYFSDCYYVLYKVKN